MNLCIPYFEEYPLKESMLAGPMAAMHIPASLAVVDVYDCASLIGKEFERLIEQYGAESITTLMPMIIRVLEHLELFAAKAEKENEEVEELKFEITRLRSKEEEKASEKQRLDKELEIIEEQWKSESQDLLKMVSTLTEENSKLKNRLAEEIDGQDALASEQEANMMEKMKSTIEKHRMQLKAAEKEQAQKTKEVEALQAQMERLTKVNADLRRKSNLNNRNCHKLMEDKAELEARLRDMEQQVTISQDKLSREGSSFQESEFSANNIGLDLTNKLIIDLKDPNRPRFTLTELREVLFERNELKTKLLEVEEELSRYKPPSFLDSDSDDDAPVQGPLPKEPDEKLNPLDKKEESVIRKLFTFLKKRHNIKELNDDF